MIMLCKTLIGYGRNLDSKPSEIYVMLSIEMHGVLGHYSALVRLYWASDNLS